MGWVWADIGDSVQERPSNPNVHCFSICWDPEEENEAEFPWDAAPRQVLDEALDCLLEYWVSMEGGSVENHRKTAFILRAHGRITDEEFRRQV